MGGSKNVSKEEGKREHEHGGRGDRREREEEREESRKERGEKEGVENEEQKSLVEEYEFPVTDLQCNDVCRAVQDLLQDGRLPVLPDESPGGAVAILLPSGVLVTENVVGHYSECG